MKGMTPTPGVAMRAGFPRMAVIPKHKRLMDVGTITQLGVLAIYDSLGLLGSSVGPVIPPGTLKAVLRAAGAGGGDQAYPGGTGNTYIARGGGGGFAKKTLNLQPADNLAVVFAYMTNIGIGFTVNGVTVCFAQNGGDAPNVGPDNGGAAGFGIVGDVIRQGGSGGGYLSNGLSGVQGSVGGLAQAPGDDRYGGAGGAGGDFGDADGIGIGWDVATGAQLVGSLPQRSLVYFYGYR